MGIYKINLEGGFSHIIKTDIINIKEFIEKLILNEIEKDYKINNIVLDTENL